MKRTTCIVTFSLTYTWFLILSSTFYSFCRGRVLDRKKETFLITELHSYFSPTPPESPNQRGDNLRRRIFNCSFYSSRVWRNQLYIDPSQIHFERTYSFHFSNIFQKLQPFTMAAASGPGSETICWVVVFMLMASSMHQADAGIVGCLPCIAGLSGVCYSALAAGKPGIEWMKLKTKEKNKQADSPPCLEYAAVSAVSNAQNPCMWLFFSFARFGIMWGFFFSFEATGWLPLCANISVFVPGA